MNNHSPVRNRIIATLEAVPHGVRLTHEELAQLAALPIDSVRTCITQLRDKGIVETERNGNEPPTHRLVPEGQRVARGRAPCLLASVWGAAPPRRPP